MQHGYSGIQDAKSQPFMRPQSPQLNQEDIGRHVTQGVLRPSPDPRIERQQRAEQAQRNINRSMQEILSQKSDPNSPLMTAYRQYADAVKDSQEKGVQAALDQKSDPNSPIQQAYKNLTQTLDNITRGQNQNDGRNINTGAAGGPAPAESGKSTGSPGPASGGKSMGAPTQGGSCRSMGSPGPASGGRSTGNMGLSNNPPSSNGPDFGR